MFQGKLDIVSDKKVKETIAVIVEKTATGSPAWRLVPEAGGFRDIGEGAIAVIPIEAVLAEEGAEQIVKSIIIEITDTNRGGPSG